MLLPLTRNQARPTRIVFGALLALMLSLPVLSQGTGATVSGTVTDASGARIPGATVAAKNLGTGIVRTSSTDTAGFFTLPSLQPGAYQLTFSDRGFITQVRSGLTLTVGQSLQLNLALKVGSQSQSVEVSGAAPAVQLATSAVSSTVDSQTMRQLPLNGRSWTDLATLQPGVANPQDQPPFNGGRGQRGFGNQISISGQRPQDNNYSLDGISMEDYSNGAPGNVEGGALGVDAVQEFSVMTGTYPAEYGNATGGVINAITRSGTNQFHGSAYEFLRNDALDARNFFDTAKPPFRRNQFGASAGGPLQKDKTFIFGDYEAIRESQGLSALDNVPTAAARAGNLVSGPVAVDPAVATFLNTLYPLPNGATNGDFGRYAFSANQVNNENFFTGRLDHTFSSTDSMSGTLVLDNNNLNSPDEFNQKRSTFVAGHKMGALQWTHIFSPNLINTMRGGIYRTPAQVGATNSAMAAMNDLKYGSVPGRTAPDVKVAGMTEFTGGVGAPSNYVFNYTTLQFNDDLMETRGTHSLKMGFSFERIRDNVTAVANGNGVFTYGSLSSFLTNAAPSNYIAAFPATVSGRSVRQSVFGAYIQDDWHFRPNLTVNAGMRYEFTTVPTETHGYLSILPSLSAPAPRLGSPYFNNPTTKDFEPRLGLDWDPTGHGTTAVRAGFGITDVLPLPYMFNLEYVFTAPFFQLGTNAAPTAGSFPTQAFTSISAGSKTLRQAYQDPAPKRSYLMQYTLNIQHQFTPSVSLMLGYVGSGGVHEPFRSEDANGVLPTYTPQGMLWPSPVGSGTKINPAAGAIRALMWAGKSNYNAFETQLNKRLSHGLEDQTSYTWSKAIDDGTGTVAGDTFNNSMPMLLWYNLSADRGPSDLNVTQSFINSMLWTAPSGASLPSAARALVGGWQVGGILRASSGVPFTPLIGGDPLGQLNTQPWDVPNVVPGCKTTTGNPDAYINMACFTFPTPVTLRGNAGRNMLTGPNQVNLDFSLVKSHALKQISDTARLQFRTEVFNILNHPNFAPPIDNSTLFNQKGNAISTAGLIDATAGSSRQIQFALKLTW